MYLFLCPENHHLVVVRKKLVRAMLIIFHIWYNSLVYKTEIANKMCSNKKTDPKRIIEKLPSSVLSQTTSERGI